MAAWEAEEEVQREGKAGRSRSQGQSPSEEAVQWVRGFTWCRFVKHAVSLAIIAYRLPWTWKCSKFLMKSIHAGLNAVAAVLAIISVVAVFDYHNVRSIPHMYSLHSWVGLTVVILYVQQVSVSLLGVNKEESSPGTEDGLGTYSFTCVRKNSRPKEATNLRIPSLGTWVCDLSFSHL